MKKGYQTITQYFDRHRYDAWNDLSEIRQKISLLNQRQDLFEQKIKVDILKIELRVRKELLEYARPFSDNFEQIMKLLDQIKQKTLDNDKD